MANHGLRAGAARWLAFFAALSFAVMLAHELTHHLAARLLCGQWGEMTLTRFVGAACGTVPTWPAVAAGPLLTLALIALGAWWRSPVGLALVFADIPLGRIANVAMRGGDELIVGRALFGERWAWPGIALVVTALLGPSLVKAWTRLPAPHRGPWFAGAMIVPTLWDFAFKRWFLQPLLPEIPVVAGMPVAVPLLWLGALLLVALTWPRTRAGTGTAAARFPLQEGT